MNISQGEPGVEVTIDRIKLIYLPQSKRLVITQNHQPIAVVQHNNIPAVLKTFVVNIDRLDTSLPHSKI